MQYFYKLFVIKKVCIQKHYKTILVNSATYCTVQRQYKSSGELHANFVSPCTTYIIEDFV